MKYNVFVVDERRKIVVPGDTSATIDFCVDQFIQIANKAIADRGKFYVAFSGGRTPHALFQKLSSPEFIKSIDWSRVWAFWSDERCVPHDHPDSNYKMAMEAGLNKLPFKADQLFAVPVTKNNDTDDAKLAAKQYDHLIKKHVPNQVFDLIMLGMGDDAHVASLFPGTEGVIASDQSLDFLVIANFVPKFNKWRISFTFDCINAARNICVYVLGKEKAIAVEEVFENDYDPVNLPAQKVGTKEHPALWIMDADASLAFKKFYNR